MVRKEIIFFVAAIFLVLISLNFTFSAHTTLPASFSVDKNQPYLYNLSLNNTGIGVGGNITQVNITLPAGFAFLQASNNSYNLSNRIQSIFTNVSLTNLSWENKTFELIPSGYNASFWFNASASTAGTYTMTVTSLNSSSAIHQTNISVTVDESPRITLISPVHESTSVDSPNITFIFNVTDASVVNCTLIVDGARTSFNSSATVTSGQNITLYYSSYAVNHTWSVNCTDAWNNQANSTTWNYTEAYFWFNGTIRDEDSNILNNSLVNITIRQQAGWTALSYASAYANTSGYFNFKVPSNSTWIYELKITDLNSSSFNSVDFVSKTIPAFPSQMLTMLAGATFYLTPAGTINITAINGNDTGLRPFQYQIKDTKLGYPIAEEHANWLTGVVVNVPLNRNYSIMIYPNMSMPVYFNWNNFSSTNSYNIPTNDTGGNNLSSYNVTTKTLHKQFNLSMTNTRVFGYINYSINNVWQNILNWTNFTVVPFLIEPGNMIHSQYGAMPYNMSMMNQQSDIFNSSGFYNITLPSPIEPSYILLFATGMNNSNYYGGFKNITLAYGTAWTTFNISVYGMLGSGGNLTINSMGGPNAVVPTAKQTFALINTTNSTLTSTSAHTETTVDYTSYGSTSFSWMTETAQSSAFATFEILLLNVTGIKEMNVFASGGPGGADTGQYSPKRVSTMTAAEITANPNVTLKTFNPQAIDTTLASSSLSINLYLSNSTCDVPNPSNSCLLTASSTMATFNPMRAVMGGGRISFRMGYGGILIHYVNVDMMASGPPDALFDSTPATTGTTATSFAAAQKFGSQGPTVYDYVLVSIPYSEAAGSGLDDAYPVSMSIPKFYDDKWNIIWDTSLNGTSAAGLAGNYSHYSTYQTAWANLTASKTCATVNVTTNAMLNATNPCYIDNSSNRIWIRLPHFSGTGPSISGNTIAAAASATTSPGGSSSYTQTVSASEIASGVTKYLQTTAQFKFTLLNESHYVTLNSVNNTLKTASITVSSTPQTFTLTEGETKKLNLNSDNYYDLEVKLSKVLSSIGANIYVHKINEEVPAVAPPAVADETQSAGEKVGEAVKETVKGTTNFLKTYWLWTVIVAIVVAVAVIFIILKKKGRYYKKGF